MLPDAMVGDPIRSNDEKTFDLPLLTGAHLKWDSFKFYESYNGGNWVLLDGSYTDSIYHRTVTQSGNYRYKTQAKVNGNYYSNSMSTVQEALVNREDSALVSLEFDGDDSYFVKDNAFNDLDVSKNYTIETWVKTQKFHPSSDYDVIMDRRGVFSLYLIEDYNADYAIRFAVRNLSDNIVVSLRSDSSSQNLSFGDWFILPFPTIVFPPLYLLMELKWLKAVIQILPSTKVQKP